MNGTRLAMLSGVAIGALATGAVLLTTETAAGPALKRPVSESVSYDEAEKTQACQNYRGDTELIVLKFHGKDADPGKTKSRVDILLDHAEQTVTCSGRGHAFDHGNEAGCGFTYQQAKSHLDSISASWDTAIDKVVGSGS